jgi:DMSO reductase anchor subunit
MSHGHGPAPEERIRAREAQVIDGRDVTPAVGRRGEPGKWRRAVEGARVRGFKASFEDARWSFLYGDERARYVAAEEAEDEVREAARRMRGGTEVPVEVKGPVLRPNVWTWEVPAYFWFGGIASGASFVAVACQAVGDERSARVARLIAVGAAGAGGPLLILDLGRPERFLHMFRIFKPRSPMSMGAWCLMAFSQTGAGAVAFDLLGRRGTAQACTVATAVLGTYLGSYTGVLLASTAVPAWSQSRTFLPPIFICTASASGAAVTRLVLAAAGTPRAHPTQGGLAAMETAAMTAELVLSAINERRLGIAGRVLEEGRPGRLLRAARGLTAAGLAVRFAGRRGPGPVDLLPSVLFLAAALAYRFGWVGVGQASARDHEAVAQVARNTARPTATSS